MSEENQELKGKSKSIYLKTAVSDLLDAMVKEYGQSLKCELNDSQVISAGIVAMARRLTQDNLPVSAEFALAYRSAKAITMNLN